jgi:hypothetical protein
LPPPLLLRPPRPPRVRRFVSGAGVGAAAAVGTAEGARGDGPAAGVGAEEGRGLSTPGSRRRIRRSVPGAAGTAVVVTAAAAVFVTVAVAVLVPAGAMLAEAVLASAAVVLALAAIVLKLSNAVLTEAVSAATLLAAAVALAAASFKRGVLAAAAATETGIARETGGPGAVAARTVLRRIFAGAAAPGAVVAVEATLGTLLATGAPAVTGGIGRRRKIKEHTTTRDGMHKNTMAPRVERMPPMKKTPAKNSGACGHVLHCTYYIDTLAVCQAGGFKPCCTQLKKNKANQPTNKQTNKRTNEQKQKQKQKRKKKKRAAVSIRRFHGLLLSSPIRRTHRCCDHPHKIDRKRGVGPTLVAARAAGVRWAGPAAASGPGAGTGATAGERVGVGAGRIVGVTNEEPRRRPFLCTCYGWCMDTGIYSAEVGGQLATDRG